MSILTDLLVFLFASILKNLSLDESSLSNHSSIRVLPTVRSSEIYQLSSILSPNTNKLLQYYDQYETRAKFPFNEQFQADLDRLSERKRLIISILFSSRFV